MRGRERLMAVIKGEIPDKLPFAPLLNDFFLSTLPIKNKIHDPVDGCRFLGVDICDRWVSSFKGYHIHPYFGDDYFDLDMLNQGGIKKIDIIENDSIYSTYTTSKGKINCKLSKNRIAGDTKFFEDMLIKNISDLPIYKHIWESVSPYANYSITQKRIEYIGNDGIAMVLIPSTPLLHLIMYDIGLEKTNYFLKDYPEKMEELLEIMSYKALEACRIAVESPAKVGIIAENSGTRLISPLQFKKYCLPIISEYAKIFKNNGKYLFLHACGHLKNLLNQIIEIDGLTGIESLNPPPTGDVELEVFLEIMEKVKVVIGGLDPIQFLKSTPDKLEATIKEIISIVSPGKNFILMPSDSTCAFTPIKNFKVVNEIINKYGKWKKLKIDQYL